MLVGYMRVSTNGDRQVLDLQRDALLSAGVDERHLFEDRATGSRGDRTGLAKALAFIKTGDCLVVWKLDRLGRSLPHLLATMADLKRRGIAFRSLSEQMDTTTPQGEFLFHIFGSLAQFELSLIQERVQAELAAARRCGRHGGRRVAIDAEKLAAVVAALEGGATKAAVCRTFGIKRSLVRHFTLSEADLRAIRRCRGDHNRLGHALMFCYLRHPGRALRSGERPPPALLAFVAEQIGILADAVDEYLAAERNRQRHAVECQEQLGLRPFGKRAAAELASALLPKAIEDDRLAHLAELAMEACRQRRIVVPSPAALERLCAKLRHKARREVYRRLTDGLTAEQRRRLDALTQRREET